mgnify:CR=1 FL=1
MSENKILGMNPLSLILLGGIGVYAYMQYKKKKEEQLAMAQQQGAEEQKSDDGLGGGFGGGGGSSTPITTAQAPVVVVPMSVAPMKEPMKRFVDFDGDFNDNSGSGLDFDGFVD